jgi:2-phosphosulfolactate phosphatase
VRVDVDFTPDEAGAAPTGLVIDVIRATSTMCQALAAGYERVFCTAEIDEARALRDALGEGVLGGERNAVRIPGFDLGNSPREYREPVGETLVLSTTNGTRAVVAAAQRCERVLVASLLNVTAVVEAARDAGDDVVVVCAGVQGTLALDDAFVAGRIVELLGWERTDAAEAAARLAGTWGGAEDAFRASRSGRNLLENAPELELDIGFCAQEAVLDVVPRLVAMREGAAEISL